MDALVPELESEQQLSARTGLDLKVLQKWRGNGEGPPWYRIGPQLVRYKRAEVNVWITSRERLPDRRHNPKGYAQLLADRGTLIEKHSSADRFSLPTAIVARGGSK